MSATNFGFAAGSWSSVDATLNGTTSFPSTGTGGATAGPSATINNSVASPNEIVGTRVGLLITFGATITGGAVTIYVCFNANGTFQSVSGTSSPATVGTPFSFQVPAQASTTVPVPFTVPGDEVDAFQVYVYNPSGNSPITVAMYTKQIEGNLG